MIDLWRARLRQHVQAQQKYLRLVFNDHFVLILLILFGGALYVYSQIVKTLQPSWWLALCLAIIFTGLLRTCLASAESGRMVENRLRSLSCQIIQAIFLERNLR